MSSILSEAYRDNPVNLHHIIPLDFATVRTLPDSHIWPKTDDLSSSFGDSQPSIPVIDLNHPDSTKHIYHACEAWGVFQITGHGIPLDLLEDAESESLRLFALPARQKLKALRSPNRVTGYGLARISPFFDKYMWHEGFTIMGSPLEHARQLWPDDDHDFQRFCKVMEAYQKKMKALAEKLKLIILKSLDITKEDTCAMTNWLDPISQALQLNSYPSCPDPNLAMGLAPHTDSFMFTILHQSDTSGLQIFKEGFGWVLVHPISGALVVNVGDILHILSNGRFPSVVHRAMVNQVNHRVSLAYFYGPPMDFFVKPAVGEVARFRSVTVKEYVGLKGKNLDKTLSLITL
ncbi:hypothetical protein ACFE04_018432 [Oxalis oulophora]